MFQNITQNFCKLIYTTNNKFIEVIQMMEHFFLSVLTRDRLDDDILIKYKLMRVQFSE